MTAPKSKKPDKSATVAHEESFKQILNALGDMVLVKGTESKLLWANQAFCDYYNMTNEQLHGLIDSHHGSPDMTQQYVIDDAKVFNSGKSLDIPCEPVTRHDGVVRMFHTLKTPIFDESGKVTMTVGISRDITSRLETEKLLEEEKGRALHSSKMAVLGEMAGGIAHEINTPLAIIMTLSGQLLELINEGDLEPETFRNSLAKIEKTSERIAKIISGLRSFSRDSSKDTFSEVSLRTVIDETLSFCRERITREGVTLELVIPDSEIKFLGHSTEISQVLLNLLSNAHDAVLNLEKKHIKLAIIETERDIEISVTDSGTGIPFELQKKVFNPFFTTKPVGKGTGLGLSISSAIIKNHGGVMFIDDTCPQTKFSIWLPKLSSETGAKVPA